MWHTMKIDISFIEDIDWEDVSDCFVPRRVSEREDRGIMYAEVVIV